jgi:hypothetical protein
MGRVRGHLSYANVTATVALLIAVAGGTAIAANNASKNSVTSSSIKPFNVTARDLAGTRVVEVDAPFSAFAQCAKGERAIGGGGSSIPAGFPDLAVSRPSGNGWLVQQGEGPNTLMAAFAICLKAEPGK